MYYIKVIIVVILIYEIIKNMINEIYVNICCDFGDWSLF